MSESWAMLDADRLPWLADDVVPRGRGRRLPLLLFALLIIPPLAGAAFWQGIARTAPQAVPAAATPSLVIPKAPLRLSVLETHRRIEPTAAPVPTAEPAMGSIRVAARTVLPREVRPVAPAALIDSRLAAPAEKPGPAEVALSGNADLPRLNQTLASLYNQTWSRADAPRRTQLLRTQVRFETRLDACRTDACRRGVYVDRMRQVSEIARRDWRPPQARFATDPKVAALNAQLAQLYSQSWTRAGADKKAKLLKTQDAFVDRMDECRSSACLNGVYLKRMREVSAIMAARDKS